MTINQERTQVRLSTSNWVAIWLMMIGQFAMALGAIWSFTNAVDSRLSVLETRASTLEGEVAEMRRDLRDYGRRSLDSARWPSRADPQP
jgi:hypothetical protein